MKLTWRDGVATVLFGAIVIPYGFYLAWGGVTFIHNDTGGTAVGILDPTGMAGLALVLGAIAAYIGRWIVIGGGLITSYVTAGLGLLAAALGVLALVGENLFNNAATWETVLGAFIASIVALWGIALARHAGLVAGRETREPARLTTA